VRVRVQRHVYVRVYVCACFVKTSPRGQGLVLI